MPMKLSGLAALLAAGLFAGAVQADTVITLNPSFPGGASEVTCEGDDSCSGLVGAVGSGTWSDDTADLYDPANSNPDTELALLNSILGLTGTDAITGAVRFDTEASSFDGMIYEYWGIKKSTDIAFFRNDTGAPIDFSMNGDEWSHVTGFGAVVPIPAAAWLFGSALLGMVGFGTRRGRKA